MSRKLALVIGNDDYDDSTLARLVTPGADAVDFARVLSDPQVGAFDEVITLTNKPVYEISRAIATFFARKRRSDLLVLYFSGHGILDEQGRLYLAAPDTEHDLLSATAIPAMYITDEMDRCQSQRQVLILDCCHSGAFARGAKGPLGVNVRTPAIFEGNGTGRVVLTATNATQYAWEGSDIIGHAENSVFTHYLIRGLETGAADSNQDGYITLEELYEYAYEQVVTHAPEGKLQTPGKWSYRQHGEIVIARNPILPAQAVPLPYEIQQVLESSQEWIRGAVVEELKRVLDSGSDLLAPAAIAALQRLALDPSSQVASTAAQRLAEYERSRSEGAVELAEPVSRSQEATVAEAEPDAAPVETPVEVSTAVPVASDAFTQPVPVIEPWPVPAPAPAPSPKVQPQPAPVASPDNGRYKSRQAPREKPFTFPWTSLTLAHFFLRRLPVFSGWTVTGFIILSVMLMGKIDEHQRR